MRSLLSAALRSISGRLRRSSAIQGEKIEPERQGSVVIASVMQQVELRNAFTVETDHLCIDDRMTFDPRRFLDNAGIAFRPVGPVHRVEVYSAVADMNLKAVAVMLHLMHPTSAARWSGGNRRTAGQNETGGRAGASLESYAT